jgi:hypothetical protein
MVGRRPRARAVVVAAAATLGLAMACQPRGAGSASGSPSPIARALSLTELIGAWRWQHQTTEEGTTRVETEVWRFRPGEVPTQLAGRYLRTVEVRADDGVPFVCNQRPVYTQRAVFDVTVELTRDGFEIHERAYRAEPSPCDHGFRHLATYEGRLDGERLRLSWGDGEQTLQRIDRELAELPADPWPASPTIEGAWRWDATSYDDEGNVHDESERWEITRRDDTHLDATYRRHVTVRSPDGETLACASAPRWSFDDAYVLDGLREEEHWHFYERGVDAGDHPCLRASPERALDEATAEQIGDYLILEWRGKRRQVLYRPASG